MMVLYILSGIMFLLIIFFVVSYNVLVNLQNLCAEAWSDVDTELKRRYDLIPNLVAAVKGYAAHEMGVLEDVARLRAQAVASTGSPASQAKDENALVAGLKNLFAVVERYPDLKASKHFLELQHELSNTEDRIQAARRLYNSNVRENNNRVMSFPSNLVANFFGFRQQEFFEIEDTGIRSAPKVQIN